MKRIFLITGLVLAIFTLPLVSAEAPFKKDGIYVTPKIGLYTWAFNFGVNVEYGITDVIGVGGDIMMAFWSDDWGILGKISESVITPSAFVAYHFHEVIDLPAELDVFAALFLGYSIYSWDWDNGGIGDWGDSAGSSLFLNPTLGARYYFTDKIAAYLNLAFAALGAYTGVGGVIGVTFAL